MAASSPAMQLVEGQVSCSVPEARQVIGGHAFAKKPMEPGPLPASAGMPPVDPGRSVWSSSSNDLQPQDVGPGSEVR